MLQRIAALSLSVLLAATASAQILPQDPDVEIVGAEDFEYMWTAGAEPARLSAAPLPLNGIPPALFTWTLPATVAHDERNLLLVRFEPEDNVIIVPRLMLEDGAREVLTAKTARPGAPLLLWSLDNKLGEPADVLGFELGIGTAGEEAVSGRLEEAGIVEAFGFSDEELLAASSRDAFTAQWRVVPARADSIRLTAMIPGVLAARYEGNRVRFESDGNLITEVPVSQTAMLDGGIAVYNATLSRAALAGETVQVRAVLERGDAGDLVLGQSDVRLARPDEETTLWEYPLQSIHSYEVFQDGPDMRILAILHDRHSRPEPAPAITGTREMVDTTVTRDLRTSESDYVWRVPAFGNIASAGFHSLSMNDNERNLLFYPTATEAQGVDAVALLSTAAGSGVRPSVKNPAYVPPSTVTGWEPNETLSIRGNTISVHQDGWLMLAQVASGGAGPRLAAFLTRDLRGWTSAGIVPLDLPEGTRHMDLDFREGIHYLFTDDPGTVYVSRDPLREWEERAVSLPEDWKAFRVIVLNEEEYLFGLQDIGGRNVLRWAPLEWSEEEIPLPRVSNAPPRSYDAETS